MPSRKIEYFSPHDINDLHNMILDIKSYPKFLPWCSAARIISENEDEIIADLVISFSGFREKYTSKVFKHHYSSETSQARVEVELIEGPFTHLDNLWVLTRKENGTLIEFDISFSFKSKILEKLIAMMFEKALNKMVESFEKRAQELYDKK